MLITDMEACGAADEVAEEQACLDLADLILETAKKVDQFAHASSAAGQQLSARLSGCAALGTNAHVHQNCPCWTPPPPPQHVCVLAHAAKAMSGSELPK